MPFSTVGPAVASWLEESLIRDLVAGPGRADGEPEEMVQRFPALVLVLRPVNFQGRICALGEW